MAEFEVPVVCIESVSPIEGADRIEAVQIGGYKSITEKGKYKVGDLAVYIPCGSLVPLSVQEELGLVGKLSGGKKNRVKEIKLKGVLSEGLVYPVENLIERARQDNDGGSVCEGMDVAEFLGIEKYEPELPPTMRGQVKAYPFTMGYDIENIKKHSRVFQEGEPVVFSEKIHGTLIQVGLIHMDNGMTTETFEYVTSKGLGKAGIIIQNNEANVDNLYVSTANRLGLFEKLRNMDEGQDLYLFGEVYGMKGQSRIQDLAYTDEVSGEPKFAAFDIYEGRKGRGRWLNVGDFTMACEAMDIPTVHYIYEGPFSTDVLAAYTSGKETISGKSLHIREGVVVRPVEEREERRLGRVILKSVSEAYLLRKGGTEFN